MRRTSLLTATAILLFVSFVVPGAHAQSFGTELVLHVTVDADSTVEADPAELQRVVELAAARGGCLPRVVDDPSGEIEYLAVTVRLRADGRHRLTGRDHRGDEVRSVFDNDGSAGYGPLLGAILSGLVRTAAQKRCAS